VSNSGYTCLYACDYNGMRLEVLEKDGQRSLQSDRSIIHSRFRLDDPGMLIQPYQQQMLASIALLKAPLRKVLILGLGGACQVGYIHQHFPDVQVDIVECSQEIIDISQKYFHLPESTRIKILHRDAKDLTSLSVAGYDLVLLDLCDSDGPIPYFQEVSYLRILSKLLCQKGWVAANTWSEKGALEKEIRLWKKIFPFVYSLEGNGDEAVIYGGFYVIDFVAVSAKYLPQNLASHLLKLH
jgi:Spermine/spermidine synthase domain